MASTAHEDIVVRLQEFFKVPNNGVVDDPPIVVSGQVRHYAPGGNRDEMSPDACVRPNMTFVPKPTTSTVIPRPPGDKSGNPHARIMCESHMREPTTGYYYRTMTAKLYRQGMAVQRWDFGNIKKHSRDPITDPPGCNAPNLAAYQITIPINEVFWDPPFPIPPGYTPAIPLNIVVSLDAGLCLMAGSS
ncbi:unnamed protein product [Rhizophagus irregularis]|nr:unnamed protein product [Rhizophagus irregularis]